MAFDDIVNSTTEQVATVWHAPIPFILCLFPIGLCIWWAVNWAYSARLESEKGRRGLSEARVADYEKKLSGATPDEAHARMERLEADVARLTPRRLTADQCAGITATARAAPGNVSVVYDMAFAGGQRLAAQLQKAFADAGWQATGGMVGGPGFVSAEGISVHIRPEGERTPSEQAALAALRSAELAFAIGPYHPHAHREDAVEIVLTQPLD
jgi:hypothetical protein